MLSVLIALCLDLALGDPYWFPHPVRGMGFFIRFFENKIFPLSSHKKAMGLIMAVVLCFFSYGIVYWLLFLVKAANDIFGCLLEAFLLWTCISFRSLYKEVDKVRAALAEKNLEKAREQLSFLVSRDTMHLPEDGIIKAAIETAAENTSDGIIAPLFFIFLGGAPLGFLYKAVNTMDSMVGYKNERYREFGFFPAKIDDVLNFIPARITGVCMVSWAFLTRKDYKQGYWVMIKEHKKSASPNAGWPEAAMAGILGVSLLGDAVYFGKKVSKPAMGIQTRPMTPLCIKDALGVMAGCVGLFVVVAVFFCVLWKGLL